MLSQYIHHSIYEARTLPVEYDMGWDEEQTNSLVWQIHSKLFDLFIYSLTWYLIIY